MDLQGRIDDLLFEARVLAIAARDPGTPWYAKAVLGVVVGLAFSPIDPIPDVIPVLGYLDDALLIPAGVLFARRLVPQSVMAEARRTANEEDVDPGLTQYVATALVVLAWGLAAYLAITVAASLF
ncbi:hypothetical protein BRC83_08670 [Halobacteriales archaeon QS_1_68_17]|nr:MAG: hypothetical protein BRC83_08670 [Halobacteriales archaeon QS_1_68_17]